MDNQTVTLPPLPAYTLKPVPRLVPWLSDFHLSLVLPVLAYWLMSLIFHLISTYNLFSKYRLHTPQEFKTRNRVTVGEVLRSIILQQTIQTALGLWLGYVLEAGDYYGKEEYDIAVWARRMRQVGEAIPYMLAVVGIDARTLGHNMQRYAQSFSPSASAEKPMAIVNLVMTPYIGQREWTGGYTAWEIYAAKTLYWVVEPAARFGIAIMFSDAWQYFWHRAMHSNKWMFRNMHAHHHKIYVPYAFGAFYNTLSEAFLLDTIGTTLSLMLSGLTIRQTMCFSTISVLKGVDDHCGYKLPWDPLQWGNEQNAAFHDIHHQSWGIKSNYSQLYTTFWDHVCDTICNKSNEEITRLYEKGRLAAEEGGKDD
ncbi:hypothetical protein JMJ35_010130 [Cladonia borealis]|uniref:Fatty acid hydroxylase domain-containing protein n=1 Tax=Cladonia borealis TaxID=184061 RepID=A0AA39QR33_9LECA|nr:hypothetical protein JMJ35_010130 [Cladonia borealis]